MRRRLITNLIAHPATFYSVCRLCIIAIIFSLSPGALIDANAAGADAVTGDVVNANKVDKNSSTDNLGSTATALADQGLGGVSLDAFGPGEEPASGNADGDEGPIIRTAVEGRRLVRQALPSK